MTATTPDQPASPTHAAPGSRARTRTRRVLAVLLGPLWVRTFRDPYRDGHLRLSDLSAGERQLARLGLVTLAFLLGSVLFADVWREGTMFQLNGENELRFLPVAALPVALLGFFLAWSLLCWGALDAAPSVRLAVAVLHLATGSTLAVSGIVFGLDSWVLEHGSQVVRVGYVATVGILVVSALVHPVLRGRPRAARVTTWVMRALVLAALAVQFGTMLWIHVASQETGFQVPVPALVDGSISQINSFLLPLVYVASIAVIDFALDVSSSVSEPIRVLSRRWVLGVLLGLVALKVVWQVVLRWDTWVAELTYQPVAVVRTAVQVALLAALVGLVTRFAPSDDYTLAKERATYGGSFALAGPFLVSVFGVGLSLFVITQFKSEVGMEVHDAIPYAWFGTEGLAIASALAVAVGVWLMRRSQGGYGDELGSALIVVGAWCAANLALVAFGIELGFTYPVVDVVVTVGVVALLAVRWRSLSTGALVSMVTLLVFSWLVNARGDYISFLGGILGLPGILVVVVGVVLTLATGSSFASNGSTRLPTDARPLLFVGYLLLSGVILFWVTVSHEPGQDQDALAAFFFLGIPMAAWLAGRRIATTTDVPATG